MKTIAFGIFPLLMSCICVASDLVVDPGNNVFLCDAGDRSIIKISPDGAATTFATIPKMPLTLALDHSGALFVADSGGALIRIDAGGAKKPVATGLKQPWSLTVDSGGNFWVFDSKLEAFLQITPDGKKKTVLRDQKYPIRPTLDKAGDLLVPVYDSHSIFKFAPDGTKTTFLSDVNDASALAFDRSGNLFIYDNIANAIVKIASDGRKNRFADWKGTARTWLLCDAAGNLFLQDEEERAVVKFAPDGTKSTFLEGLSPIEATFDRSGNLLAWDGHTVFKVAPDGTKSALFSAWVSSDRQWEYRCSDDGDNAGIGKVGSTELDVDFSENIPAQWAHGVTVHWAPDSKRVGLNYQAGARDNETVLYQLKDDKWVEIHSPEDEMGKALERVQSAKAVKEHLPKKTYRRRIWDTYETRQWIDNNTAILYGYSNRSVQFNRDLSTNEETGDYDDLVAHMLFTLKFDAKGNWKIIRTHEMSAKEIDEVNND